MIKFALYIVATFVAINAKVEAFLSPQQRCVAFSPANLALKATPTEAIISLENSQASSLDKIASSIPDLESKPDLSWNTADGVEVNGNPAILDGRDAPGPANVAWLAAVNVANKMSSLTIFNGPLTIAPHLLSRCIINDDNTISFALDFRPRGYGAYETKDSEGNYPGPDTLGRVAFTYSGNRKEYETKFGTSEVESFVQSTLDSFEDAVIDTEANEFEKLTQGPLSVKVSMSLTDGNIAAVAAAREKAVDYWLTWALEDTHAHRPGAPINTQYVYDAKYRQNAYQGLLPCYSAAFGADGAGVCAAESGPLDEGYVGGGS